MSQDVQKYEATVKRDEKERVIMKLTEQILNLEEQRIDESEQDGQYGDYGELNTNNPNSSPTPAGVSASGNQSEPSKRVGNALFVLKGRANQRPKL